MNLRVIPCTDCHKFDFCKQYEDENRNRVDKAGVWVGIQSPIRKCQHAIIDIHFAILNGKNVLEVGCGSSKKGGFIKNAVEKNGNRWTGIDIVETDLTSYVCDVTNMPFADGSFDTVIGNQTMEHWPNVLKALGEIHRVLEPVGRVYLNVPIHLHETKDFVLGDLVAIDALFIDAGFVEVEIETWRQVHEPLKRYLPDESLKHLKKFGMKPDSTTTAYIANFIARKPYGI